MAVLGLRFCARAFSSCGKRGTLFIAVRGPLSTAASLVAEHRLQTLRLSNCGSRAQSLHGTWDLPRPGLEPAFPALAGRLSTTAPPGKPPYILIYYLGAALPPALTSPSNLTQFLVSSATIMELLGNTVSCTQISLLGPLLLGPAL